MDFNSSRSELNHYWELCVGSCHAATALREDYRIQLEQCSKELGFKYVRFHDIFNDDMSVLTSGGAMMSRESGEMILSFTNIDSIFDFLLSIGMRPFIELGFMPRALTSGNCKIFHYDGLTSPPDDYEKWQWFIEQFVGHCVKRYGLGEVRQWFFEVWNEPNLGGRGSSMGFWGGSMEDYFKLYEHAAKGVKAVDSRLRVGGPATSDNAWIPEFLEFCKTNNVPVDFVSTHHYPTDINSGFRHGRYKMNFSEAQGELTEEKRAEMVRDMVEQQRNRFKDIPRGILTDFCREVREEAEGLPVYYTEWNSGAGIVSDGPFGAAFVAKTCMDNHGLAEGYSYWTFSDIFEEGGMPYTPFHGGFGLMTLQGIPKASYRAYELLHKLGSELYDIKFSEGTVDIYPVHKPESGCIQLLAVNHQSMLQDISPETVKINLTNLPGYVTSTVERVDEDNANAIKRWRELGSPDYLSQKAIYDILSTSYITTENIEGDFNGGNLQLTVELPEQGIALVTVYY